MNPMAILRALALGFALSACTTTLAHKTDLRDAKLEIGSTHKSQVAEVLGLPSQMKREPQSGRELWAYREKPTLSAIHYAVPTSTTSADVRTDYIDSAGPAFANAALVCVFSNQGVLQELRWREDDE